MQSIGFIKRIICAAALALVLVYSTGCALTFSADNLLTPPKLTDEQTEIYNVLTESAGKVTLRYPRQGEYRSAFVINNLDEEYSNEAIVFYEIKGSADNAANNNLSIASTGLRIGFLDKDDSGEWRIAYEIPAEGTAVESVSFSTLGGNKPRLIISFSALNSSDKIVEVIDYTDGIATPLTKIVCSQFMIEEFSRENAEDLLCFVRDKEAKAAVFGAYGCNENSEFGKVYNTVQLSNEISEYSDITIGKCLSEGKEKSCIAIDYLKSDNLYGTDMIYFTGSNFVTSDIFIRDSGETAQYTRRTNNYTPLVFSADVDGDGILDVPVTSAMPGYENLTFPEQINAFSWYRQSSEGIKKIYYTFIDPGLNYMLIFPGRWEGMVTATINTSENSVTFWKSDNATSGTLDSSLLSIRSIVKNKDFNEKLKQNAERDGYNLFYEDCEKLIYVKNVLYDEMSLTNDEITAALQIRPEDHD